MHESSRNTISKKHVRATECILFKERTVERIRCYRNSSATSSQISKDIGITTARTNAKTFSAIASLAVTKNPCRLERATPGTGAVSIPPKLVHRSAYLRMHKRRALHGRFLSYKMQSTERDKTPGAGGRRGEGQGLAKKLLHLWMSYP